MTRVIDGWFLAGTILGAMGLGGLIAGVLIDKFGLTGIDTATGLSVLSIGGIYCMAKGKVRQP